MSETQPERPTFWIVLSIVLLLVAVAGEVLRIVQGT